MRYLILLCLALPALSGCDEDSFSQVVDIPLPEHEGLPALAMGIVQGDTALDYRISLSRGVLEEEPADGRATELVLYRDGEQLERVTGTLQGDFVFRYFNQSIELEEPIGPETHTYRIEGTVEGAGTAYAEQTMPAPPVIRDIRYDPDGVVDTDGSRRDGLSFDLVDPAGITNYYAFRVIVEFPPVESCQRIDMIQICDTVPDNRTLRIESPNLLLGGLGQAYGLGITDESFDGTTTRIRLSVQRGNKEYRAYLEVLALTEEGYRYLRSRIAYLDARDNPFAEPVTVANNIEDGYGFFMVSNRVRIEYED